MFVEKPGILSLFSFSASGVFIYFVIEVGFVRQRVGGSECGRTGLGRCSSASLHLMVSLCSLPLASARPKGCLLWHLSGTAVCPVWFRREFSQITVWTELRHPWPHGVICWGKHLCVSWGKHSSGTDLRLLFVFLGSCRSPSLRNNLIFFCISYSGIMY